MTQPAPAIPLPGAFRIGVIGAGLAGLACAAMLHARGARVLVFEAMRRPGGRAATYVTPHGSFDHGAQYFTARDAVFQSVVDGWVKARVIEPWRGRVLAFNGSGPPVDKTETILRYVPRDGMQALARHMAADLDVHYQTPVAKAERGQSSWQLVDGSGQRPSPGGFDAVIVAVPAAATLLAGAPELAARAQRIVWQPCWSALLAVEAASGFDFAGAFVNDHPVLAWLTRASAMPVSTAFSGVERWILHAVPRWSALNLNLAVDDAAAMLADAFAKRFNFSFRPSFLTAVRWDRATPSNPLKRTYLWDAERRIGAVGDWCNGRRIEDAYLSGLALGLAVQA